MVFRDTEGGLAWTGDIDLNFGSRAQPDPARVLLGSHKFEFGMRRPGLIGLTVSALAVYTWTSQALAEIGPFSDVRQLQMFCDFLMD